MDVGMAEKAPVKILICACLILVVTIFVQNLLWLPYKRLPPGPRPWPIIGNLLQLRYGVKSLIQLSEKYGPACTVWMGSVPNIIISGPELIPEGLVRHADALASRWDRYTTKLLSAGYSSVTLSSATRWKVVRRNLARALYQWGQRSYDYEREFEFRDFVSRVRSEARKDPNDEVLILRQIRMTICNVFSTMCFGERMAEESTWDYVDSIFSNLVALFLGGLADYFIIFRPFEWLRGEARVPMKRLHDLIMPLITKHRKSFRKEAAFGRYVEILLNTQAHHAEAGLEPQLTDEVLVVLCSEVMNAGTETTSSTTEWAFGFLLCNPDAQRKLLQEMDEVLGDKKLEESDIDRLPYLQAVVKETLRLRSPGDFTLPYRVTRPGLNIGGFDIPRDAAVMFRLTSVHSDPKIWSEPHVFRPERFMKDKMDTEMGGSKVSFASFSLGRRTCPGMNIGLKIMSMLLGSLVQTFELSIAGPEDAVPDMTMAPGHLPKMNSRLRLRLKDRKRRITQGARTISLNSYLAHDSSVFSPGLWH